MKLNLLITVTRVLDRPAPDYITIDDSDAGTPANPLPIIDNIDANVYDGQQSYLCETGINTSPDNTLFGVCYNDGRCHLQMDTYGRLEHLEQVQLIPLLEK